MYLHVIYVEVLLNDGCGLLLQLFLGQGRLGGGRGRWRRGSCLPLHCSYTKHHILKYQCRKLEVCNCINIVLQLDILACVIIYSATILLASGSLSASSVSVVGHVCNSADWIRGPTLLSLLAPPLILPTEAAFSDLQTVSITVVSSVKATIRAFKAVTTLST